MRMKKTGLKIILILMLFLPAGIIAARGNSNLPIRNDSLLQQDFIKTELNSGFLFFRNNNREALITDRSEHSFERADYNADYFYGFNSWAYKKETQAEFSILSGVGFLSGKGTSMRTDNLNNIKLDDKIFGLNLFMDFNYASRFYFDEKNFTIVEAKGFGRVEKIRKHSEGFNIPSYGHFISPLPHEEKILDNRLRYGVHGRAGWGTGKMAPANYYMLADYIFDKYYNGQLFSETEKKQLATIIARVKNNRSVKTGHSEEAEIKQFKEAAGKKLLIRLPEGIEEIWGMGEFSPRLDGTRFEVGPFFSYYNREPDFIYGGYVKFEKKKYCNLSGNLNFTTELSYNRYKKRDWVKWETGLFYDFYPNLRTKYSFGLTYIPVLIVNDFNDIEPVQHVLIPSFSCYSQVNEKLRASLSFLYRIADENDFFMEGPEFSLAIYRSRY